MDIGRTPLSVGGTTIITSIPSSIPMTELPAFSMDSIDVSSLPEMERFTVELKKDINYGLGITIAGYVCEKGNTNRLILIA